MAASDLSRRAACRADVGLVRADRHRLPACRCFLAAPIFAIPEPDYLAEARSEGQSAEISLIFSG
jgi:hypothetical protein